jgi:hypothetical protein
MSLYRQWLRGCVFHASSNAVYSAQPRRSAHLHMLTTLPMVPTSVSQNSVLPYLPAFPVQLILQLFNTEHLPERIGRQERHATYGNAILA